MQIFQIAIDGPAGSGKSTISKLISKKYGIEYIDTGAMYRALTYKAIQTNTDVRSESDIEALLQNTDIDFKDNSILLDGYNVDAEIRQNVVNKNVSYIASYASVREKLVDLQRKLSHTKSVIMDGRDIGTTVLPHAKYKFFLNATAEVRGKRRYIELLDRGEKGITEEGIIEEIRRRDHIDSTRKISPLKKASDAIEIDTSNLSIEEVVIKIISNIEELNHVL